VNEQEICYQVGNNTKVGVTEF